MDMKSLGKLWLAGWTLFFLGSLLLGCSTRWSPTDPRLDTADPSQAVVLERWEIGVSTEINPTP
ncbi:MAG: hypothetical protein AB1439_07030 [candidate division FCPU426 bacterium]